MKVKWTKETPEVEGWYWIKYKNKRNFFTVCPAQVINFAFGRVVLSARNDTFMEGPNHGGWGLKYAGESKVDTSIRFGPKIEEPD